jgi:hypothetical protein
MDVLKNDILMNSHGSTHADHEHAVVSLVNQTPLGYCPFDIDGHTSFTTIAPVKQDIEHHA